MSGHSRAVPADRAASWIRRAFGATLVASALTMTLVPSGRAAVRARMLASGSAPSQQAADSVTLRPTTVTVTIANDRL